jgi:hypothetical protein
MTAAEERLGNARRPCGSSYDRSSGRDATRLDCDARNGIAASGHYPRLSDPRLSGCQTIPSATRHSEARSPMTNNDTDGPEILRAQQKRSR